MHDADGHLAYLNMVTHQVLWTCPDALAWRQQRHANGQLFWFNYRTNATKWEQPPELHGDTERVMKGLSRHYWTNSVTGAAHSLHCLAALRSCMLCRDKGPQTRSRDCTGRNSVVTNLLHPCNQLLVLQLHHI